MNTLKNSFWFVLLLTALIAVPGRSGNHTVTTTIEVTQTAINRYLNTQYNAAGFPKNISVNVSGTNYTISLTLPNILLSTGKAKLQMVFDVWQGSPGSTLLYHFAIQPSVNIPSTEISGADIEAFLTNLSTTLDAVSPALPAWVKTNILSNFNTRGWMIYPSKLLAEANSTWFAQRGLAISINDVILATEVVSGVFKLTLSIPMTANAPYFYAQIIYNQYYQPAVIALSYNNDIVVDEVRILDVAGNLKQQWPNDVSLQKGIQKWWYTNFTPDPNSIYFIWILFKTDNTFMVRKWKADGSGLSSHIFDSIN